MIHAECRPRPFLPALALALALSCAAPARAQGCWSPGATGIAFAAVSPDKETDAQGAVRLTCQSDAAPGFVRYCIYIGDGSPIAGIAPRWLTNYNGAQMAYDLYADAGRTQSIGPPPAGGGFSVYTSTLALPGGHLSSTATAPLYGRVPAGQILPATALYQSQITNTSIAWAYSPTAYPPSCTSGTLNGVTSFYLGVTATAAAGCRISLATDLDFGAAVDLSAARDQNSKILVRCPLGVPWAIALDDGLHSAAGTRRMQTAGGQLLAYELYQDAARSQRWGDLGAAVVTGVGAGETLPHTAIVHGRVPGQPIPKPGAYNDAVTATLTY